jgi:hypothetical protein
LYEQTSEHDEDGSFDELHYQEVQGGIAMPEVGRR